MGELLKTYFLFYIDLMVFEMVWIAGVVIALIKRTKNIEYNMVKITLRIVICSALIGLWAYFIVYRWTYPISLAYYEYKNNLAEEKSGVIDSIDRKNRDYIHIKIDDTIYIMAYNSQDPYNNVTIDIVRGDTVRFVAGEKSKYIFDISKVKDQ